MLLYVAVVSRAGGQQSENLSSLAIRFASLSAVTGYDTVQSIPFFDFSPGPFATAAGTPFFSSAGIPTPAAGWWFALWMNLAMWSGEFVRMAISDSGGDVVSLARMIVAVAEQW